MKILVVDDNEELAENLAEILNEEGHETLVAANAEAALVESRDFSFDVALVDVRMPGMDGIDLHRLLREDHGAARYVLMTAYTRDERLAQADIRREDGDEGAVLIFKPFRTETLLRVLRGAA